MASFTLTKGELLDLTGKAQTEAQKAELRTMGVDFYERSDGSLAVLRSTVEKGEDSGSAVSLNLDAA